MFPLLQDRRGGTTTRTLDPVTAAVKDPGPATAPVRGRGTAASRSRATTTRARAVVTAVREAVTAPGRIAARVMAGSALDRIIICPRPGPTIICMLNNRPSNLYMVTYICTLRIRGQSGDCC